MIQPSKLISKLTKELEDNPLVVGFVLVGSQAREDAYLASKYSDLEAYIIVSDGSIKKVESQLAGIVNKLGKVIFSYKNRWAGFSTVFEDLFRLELPIVDESNIANVFSRPKAQTVEVLIDKTNGKLQKALDNRPETLDFQSIFQFQVTDFWYMAIVATQYWKKGEFYNARSALSIITSSLIVLFELLNEPSILLLETNKRIEKFLTSKQIKTFEQITAAYDRNGIKLALKSILDIFSKTSEQVSKKYGYTYLENVEHEIKPKLTDLLDK